MEKVKFVIYGEGPAHMPFMGVFYMKDQNETDEQAAYRFNETVKKLGFEWLPDRIIKGE